MSLPNTKMKYFWPLLLFSPQGLPTVMLLLHLPFAMNYFDIH